MGSKISIPTPDGNVVMKVPAGVDSGQSLRLRGKGWPNRQGKRGDQIAHLKIVTPKKLNRQEREYYQKLQQLNSFNPRRQLEGMGL